MFSKELVLFCWPTVEKWRNGGGGRGEEGSEKPNKKKVF